MPPGKLIWSYKWPDILSRTLVNEQIVCYSEQIIRHIEQSVCHIEQSVCYIEQSIGHIEQSVTLANTRVFKIVTFPRQKQASKCCNRTLSDLFRQIWTFLWRSVLHCGGRQRPPCFWSWANMCLLLLKSMGASGGWMIRVRLVDTAIFVLPDLFPGQNYKIRKFFMQN